MRCIEQVNNLQPLVITNLRIVFVYAPKRQFYLFLEHDFIGYPYSFI